MTVEVSVDVIEMGDEIARLSTAIDRATQQQLALLRQFDEAQGWADTGATSCAAWLSWRTGMSPGAGRERVRVAHALGELPMIDAAFAGGELSYSKVRALCRVATAESEETLLGYARLMTGAELEKLVAQLRRIELAEHAGDGAVEPERFYRHRTTDDGMVRLTIQVTADEATVIAAMLDDSAEAPNRRAEALVAIADERLRGDASDRSPTEAVVHIDAGAVSGELAGITSEGELLPAETCKRLLCDAGVVPVLEDERGRTLDVGRKTRTIPPAIRRALSMRDGGCQFPGCDHQIVDGHHVEHWIEGGETSLDNLVSLCRRHHRFVHEGGTTAHAIEGGFEFRLRGVVIDAVPPRPAAAPLHRAGDPWLACPKRDTASIDWPYLVDVAASQLHH